MDSDNTEKIECARCWGSGWIAHDAHCSVCDGAGMVDSDPFFDRADVLYDETKEVRGE